MYIQPRALSELTNLNDQRHLCLMWNKVAGQWAGARNVHYLLAYWVVGTATSVGAFLDDLPSSHQNGPQSQWPFTSPLRLIHELYLFIVSLERASCFGVSGGVRGAGTRGWAEDEGWWLGVAEWGLMCYCSRIRCPRTAAVSPGRLPVSAAPEIKRPGLARPTGSPAECGRPPGR